MTLSQLFYAYSYDAGPSWSLNVAVSPVFDSYAGWPQQAKIGDYYTIVSGVTGADVAYAATFNGEQDVYYVRVFPDCNGNGVSDVTDIAGGSSTDCDANHVPDECQAVPLDPLCTGAGSVPDGRFVTGTPLTLSRTPAGGLALSWGASCKADDEDYGVYEGRLGDFTSHSARLCSTAGKTSVLLAPAAGGTYYLVVPSHRFQEGSYGKDGGGTERPRGRTSCFPRVVHSCR